MLLTKVLFLAALCGCFAASAQNAPSISLVANAEGENAIIAPNTWVEVKGQNLSRANDSRIWQASDFTNGQMPTKLDGVSVTVNGKSAFIYYISPTQVNILTPPDAISGPVVVQVTTNNGVSAPLTVQAQALSPSFFVFNGGPYVAAAHLDGTYLGPPGLVSGAATTPAKPGEIVVLYANGFGPTSVPVVGGSSTQGGTLSPLPAITIGGLPATVQFAGLVFPGQFQFNVVVPANAPSGDNPVIATYNGAEAAPAAAITVQGSAAAPTSVTFYVAPNGNDLWSGRLSAPNSTNTDGPFATFDHARALVQSISKAGLNKVIVQFRGGTYFLPATVMFTAADSGSAATPIVYQNYPGEIAGLQRRRARPELDQPERQHLEDHAARVHAIFREPVLQRSAAAAPTAGRGVLGTYYRIANTVYLNAAAPPAAAPNPNCAVYIAGSGWECFDRFQYNPADPIVGYLEEPRSGRGQSLRPAGRQSGHRGRYRGARLRTIQHLQTAHQLHRHDESDRVPDRTDRDFAQANSTEVGFIAGNRYLVDNVQDAADAARPVVSGPLHHALDAHLPGQHRRESEYRHW